MVTLMLPRVILAVISTAFGLVWYANLCAIDEHSGSLSIDDHKVFLRKLEQSVSSSPPMGAPLAVLDGSDKWKARRRVSKIPPQKESLGGLEGKIETAASTEEDVREKEDPIDSDIVIDGSRSISDHTATDNEESIEVVREKADASLSHNHQMAATKEEDEIAYSLAHPTEFKLNTPNAPSCSFELDASSISFTLVTQISYDRVWMIPCLCQRWGDHPFSVVVFSTRDPAQVKAKAVNQGCSEEHLTVQTVNRTKYDPDGTEYPVNILRNLALAAVKTSHAIYADADFWPATNLHSILTSTSVKNKFASDPHLAAVIPAFEMFSWCKWSDCTEKNIPAMPEDNEALLSLMISGKASSFHANFEAGHGSTDYVKWMFQKEGSFEDLPCINNDQYEPYVALRYCKDLPPFQEGFTGYGKNKMTWIMQLRKSGYQFSQLGGSFLVHYPHGESQSKQEWSRMPDELYYSTFAELDAESKEKIDWASFKRSRVDALFLEFTKWMNSTVKDKARVPMCENAENKVPVWVPLTENVD